MEVKFNLHLTPETPMIPHKLFLCMQRFVPTVHQESTPAAGVDSFVWYGFQPWAHKPTKHSNTHHKHNNSQDWLPDDIFCTHAVPGWYITLKLKPQTHPQNLRPQALYPQPRTLDPKPKPQDTIDTTYQYIFWYLNHIVVYILNSVSKPPLHHP